MLKSNAETFYIIHEPFETKFISSEFKYSAEYLLRRADTFDWCVVVFIHLFHSLLFSIYLHHSNAKILSILKTLTRVEEMPLNFEKN